MNDLEKCAQAVDLVEFAGEGRCQIEAETVDVHFKNPITQAVHDELQHARVAHVERVAGTGVVEIVARVVRDSR